MTVNIPSRLVLCGLLLRLAATAAEPLYNLPAYTKWCVAARLEGDEAVSEAAYHGARLRATRTIDEKLSAARVASSSAVYMNSATAETGGGPDKPVRLVRLDFCAIVPPSSQPGPDAEPVVVHVTPPGEQVAAIACEAAETVACLTKLRKYLFQAFPDRDKEAIEEWNWRTVPSRADVRGQELEDVLTDFSFRPTILPISSLAGSTLDPPALDAQGKPVLRPLRIEPVTAPIEPPATAAIFRWVVIAITVPPDRVGGTHRLPPLK